MTSLRRKLALAYMGLILAVLALAGFFLLDYLAEVFIDSVSRDLAVRAALVRESVSTRWPMADNAAGDVLARQLADTAQSRVTVIAPDGRVLAESEQTSASMANHGDRAEFLTAVGGEIGFSRRYSETRADRMLYAAIPMYREGQLAAVVRVAISLESVWASIGAVRNGLFGALGAGLLFAGAAGLGLGTVMLSRPLSRIVQGARRFAAGDLRGRIEVRTGDEWEVLATSLNEMAGELDGQIQTLAAERTRIRNTLEGLPDGVLLLSRRGALHVANRKARQWLSLAEALGEYQPDPFQGSTRVRAGTSSRAAVEVLGRTPEVRDFVRHALTTRTDQGAELTLRGAVAARLDARSSWVGAAGSGDLLVVLHDISEMRHLESARRDLVANVSHELKTPIGAIRVLAESLAADPGDDRSLTVDFLGRIVRETERLSSLVEEMLYLSRLESEADALARVAADLGDIARRAIEAVKPLASAKNVRITSDWGPDITLGCDPERVERAIRALLDNAVRFSPAGGTVVVRATSRGDQVEFEVTDQGPGIPSEALPRVFERFYKVEQSRAGPGSGLGLAIVKHVIQSHGGRVYAQSTVGQGSLFGFTLPRRDS